MQKKLTQVKCIVVHQEEMEHFVSSLKLIVYITRKSKESWLYSFYGKTY